MKRLVILLLALLPAVMQGKSVSDIKVTSCEVIRLDPHDGTCAKAWVDLTFDNQFAEFELSDVTMSLFIDRQWYVDLVVDPTECFVLKKGIQHRVFTTEVVFSPNANPFLLLGLVKSYNRPLVKLIFEGRPAVRLAGLGATVKIARNLDDVDFGSLVRDSIVGLPIDAAFKALKLELAQLKGCVDAFDLLDIKFTGDRTFLAEIRLGLDMTTVLMDIKERLTVSDVCGSLYLDDVFMAYLSELKTHTIEVGKKTYLLTVEGKMDDNFNPCLLLAFLKDRNQWPQMSFRGSIRFPYLVGVKKEFTLP